MKIVHFLLCCFAFTSSFGSEVSPEDCPELELYYSPYCYYSHKVLNFLKNIHKMIPLKDVIHDANAKAELKEKGGKLQVPCLFINGHPLYESDHIILWLTEHKDCLEDTSSKSNDLLE